MITRPSWFLANSPPTAPSSLASIKMGLSSPETSLRPYRLAVQLGIEFTCLKHRSTQCKRQHEEAPQAPSPAQLRHYSSARYQGACAGAPAHSGRWLY